jgi:hypothetical protein
MLGRGIAAGILSAAGGAVLWAALVGVFQLRLGFLAIGVGSLVGMSVRKYGRGRDERFGVAAMFCAAFGCLLGDIWGGAISLSIAYNISVFRVLSHLNLELVRETLFTNWTFMDLIFYMIAMCFAYKLSVIDE